MAFGHASEFGSVLHTLSCLEVERDGDDEELAVTCAVKQCLAV